MKLPEAIALMLEGKVMVDEYGNVHKAVVFAGDAFLKRIMSSGAQPESAFLINGWREATPEELKEIGL